MSPARAGRAHPSHKLRLAGSFSLERPHTVKPRVSQKPIFLSGIDDLRPYAPPISGPTVRRATATAAPGTPDGRAPEPMVFRRVSSRPDDYRKKPVPRCCFENEAMGQLDSGASEIRIFGCSRHTSHSQTTPPFQRGIAACRSAANNSRIRRSPSGAGSASSSNFRRRRSSTTRSIASASVAASRNWSNRSMASMKSSTIPLLVRNTSPTWQEQRPRQSAGCRHSLQVLRIGPFDRISDRNDEIANCGFDLAESLRQFLPHSRRQVRSVKSKVQHELERIGRRISWSGSKSLVHLLSGTRTSRLSKRLDSPPPLTRPASVAEGG